MLRACNTLSLDVFPEVTDLPPPPAGHRWYYDRDLGPAWVLLQMDQRWNRPMMPPEIPTVTEFSVGQMNLGPLGMVNVPLPITGETTTHWKEGI